MELLSTLETPVADFNAIDGSLGGWAYSRTVPTGTNVADGYYVNSAGLLSKIGPNNPRFEYDPSTKALLGMPMYPAVTNRAFQSTSFGQSGQTYNWARTNCNIATGIADPAGGTNAVTISTSAGQTNGTFSQARALTQVGAKFFSVWVKGDANTQTIQLSVTGTFTTVTVQQYWTRVWVKGLMGPINPSIRLVEANNSVTVFGPSIDVSSITADLYPAQLALADNEAATQADNLGTKAIDVKQGFTIAGNLNLSFQNQTIDRSIFNFNTAPNAFSPSVSLQILRTTPTDQSIVTITTFSGEDFYPSSFYVDIPTPICKFAMSVGLDADGIGNSTFWLNGTTGVVDGSGVYYNEMSLAPAVSSSRCFYINRLTLWPKVLPSIVLRNLTR